MSCVHSLKLKESKSKGGGLVVESVSGNAAKSGIKAGDTIIYASSFFGDELWPTDKLSFTQTAIQRAPSPVAFVYVRPAVCLHIQQLLGLMQQHMAAIPTHCQILCFACASSAHATSQKPCHLLLP